jgi:hypothetical protein
VLSLAACSSTATDASRQILPFHVAVLPIELVALAGAPRAESPEEQEATEVEDVTLSLDERAVSEAFTAALAADSFVRASLLEYPPDVSPEEFRGRSVEEQDTWWIEAGRDADADLLVRGVLTYYQGVRTDTNDAFWLNLPLFLLGGPMTYFVNDRSYFLEARFQSSVYDLPALVRDLEEGPATLHTDRRLQEVRPDVREATLDFIDRADHAGHYALSLVVPPGYLATETADVQSGLEEEVVAQLMDEMGRAIAAQSEQLVEPDLLVEFVVHPEDLRLVRSADGRGNELSGVVLLGMREGGAPSMRGCRLSWDGGQPLDYRFNEGTRIQGDSRESFLRYPFVFELPIELPEFLRLEVEDDSGSRAMRSYHLATGRLEVVGS